MLRKLLVTAVGHVDHGKSSLLDAVRGSSIVSREPGAITQAIGASVIPMERIASLCGPSFAAVQGKLTIPGILAIDTPGHAAFTNLRKRGGALADLAVVVVDINEGFMPQTVEAIEILRQGKTPFVVCANKIDLVPGFSAGRSPEKEGLVRILAAQSPGVFQDIDTRLYALVGALFERFAISADRYDRVTDYSKTVAVVPASSKMGLGVPELLLVLLGLAQRYLGDSLQVDVTGPAKGTVLEVKEEKGMGTVLDAIIYDGTLKARDTVIIGSLEKPLTVRVKALFEPEPLAEMRDKKTRFLAIKEATAAAGVRISPKDGETAQSGMPFESVPEGASPHDINAVARRVQAQVESVIIETDQQGVVIKADALGSLEAMISLLRQAQVPIRRANIGPVTKKDLIDAEANRDKDPLLCAVLGFNVQPAAGLLGESVKVITNNVIYKIVEEYESWKASQVRQRRAAELEGLSRPFKIEILRGYVFRQSNPAVVGCHVLGGILQPNVQAMKADGKQCALVKSIQLEKENVERAVKDQEVAISLPHVIVGRTIQEGDILFSSLSESEFRKLKDLKDSLGPDEREVLKEIAAIMRKENPVWGL